MTIPRISCEFGMCRSTIQVSIRTIRKCGVSQLNLTELEKNQIEKEIKEEIEKYNIQGVQN